MGEANEKRGYQMNFLNKWIQKLKRQDQEQSFDQYVKDPPSLPNYQKSGKDVEARITYQYPKGQFRFPVTPDREVRKKRTAEPGKGENRRIHERRRLRAQNIEPEASKPEQEKKSNKVEVKKGPKKPFSPTQIPSPIYGFQNRREHDSQIDFQLSRLNTVQPPITNHSVDTYEKGFFTKILGDDIQENKDLPTDSNEEIITPGILKDLFLEEKEYLKEMSQPEEAVGVSEIFQGEKGITEPSFIVEEDYYKQESQNNSIHDELEEPKESIEVVQVERLEHQSSQLEEMTDQDFDTKDVSREGNESTRPHLPFNVVMLKQDKQKWERSHQNEAVLQAKKEEIKNEETMDYIFPSQNLLTPKATETDQADWIEEQAKILNQTLKHFHVNAKVVACSQGPSVTRFEVQPEPGVKVNKITNLIDDLKLSLAAKDIRMEAPIPGKHTIGIEIPNKMSRPVHLRELTEHPSFQKNLSPLTVALGLDISGEPIMTDLKKMPHGLIAGATGSGKSVCINSILVSLMYKANPDRVKLLLIDPKMVELTPYNGIPHLVAPVITDVKAATTSLKWAVQEMESRYDEFAKIGVRDIERYNAMHPDNILPYVVIIIDELADLMMIAPGDVEDAICRIAQKARACGIHLIVATQRPSVDVITGLIKANVPTRIAFSVSSQVDSRTIIDTSGAERLLGKGDMLFLENGASKPIRLQGTFVSDIEIDAVVDHVSMQKEPEYLFHQDELLQKAQIEEEEDELFLEACQFVVEQGNASTSLLQRRFRVGYNRAARLMEMMESQGIVSEAKGTKPRDVLITEDGLHTHSESE